MNSASHSDQQVFSPAARWTLCVLAWAAFGVSAYLAWSAIGRSPLAGCGPGSGSGCDEVLTSSWSKWLGIPVAVIGLACYATLAGLSVLLGIENSPASRWIKTAFVMFSVAAAGASLWFLGVQVFALGKFCPYCLVTDLCGLAIGGITLWSVAWWFVATRSSRQREMSGAGIAALRTTLSAAHPTESRLIPSSAAAVPLTPIAGHHPKDGHMTPTRSATLRTSGSPLLPHAIGGGVALLVLLVGGQILNPTKTYSSFSATLDQPVALNGKGSAPTSNSDGSPSAESQSHVAMRIPPDLEITEPQAAAEPLDSSASATSAPSDASAGPEAPPDATTGPQTERILEFLNGSLKLDIYEHAHIGSPEAPHVMVEMLSYDCSHCRQMHRTIKKGLTRYGDQLAVIVIPIPMEMKCNPLVTTKEASHSGACTIARMALGVAAIRPDQFHPFHDWLMADKDSPPQQSVVVSKAYHTVEPSRLSELSQSKQLDKRIADYITLYSRLNRQMGAGKGFGLPVQILGDQVISGTVEKERDVFDAWEKHLGVVRN